MAELSLKRVASPGVGARTPTRRRGLTRQQLRWLLIALGPLLVLLAAAYLYFSGGRYVTTDDSYVRADTVSLATDVSGMVAQVLVRDNERVKAGEPLYRLDPKPFRIALDQAEAALSVSRNTIAALQANYRQKLAAIALAEKELAFYEREYQRQQALAGRSFASQQALDAARERRDSAQGTIAELKQDLAAIAAQLNDNPSLPIERQPQYRHALAAVAKAEYDLSRSVVRAPFSGYVTGVSALTPGTYLGAGTTGFYLVALHRNWIEADPKETALTHVAAGQPVVITVDTYPGIEWRGTVENIAPASASSFSLLPAQNTSGNWVKVVQRVPVRIRIDAEPGKPELRSGMSVEVSIDTGRYWRLPHFLASLFGTG